MVGFRKEIAREENLELIPAGTGGGNADLLFQAWDETGLVIQRWQLPLASISTTGSPTRIPEPGDIIRARWEQAGTMLNVRGSYFDASAQSWYADVINATVNLNALHGVNFNDGAHLASSITSDTEFYSIRRFRVGTLDTYGQELPSQCPATLTPQSGSVPFDGGAGTVAVEVPAGCAWTAVSREPWLTITSGATSAGAGSRRLAGHGQSVDIAARWHTGRGRAALRRHAGWGTVIAARTANGRRRRRHRRGRVGREHHGVVRGDAVGAQRTNRDRRLHHSRRHRIGR